MSRPTPILADFAKAIVAHEFRGNKSSEAKIPAGCLAIEKLRSPLANLLGNTGFNALFYRACALGSQKFPWLRALPVKPDGSLEEFYEAGTKVEAEEFREGCVLLLSHLLALLVAFIGKDLTLRLVGTVWPELSPDDLDFGKGHQE
jgi:hypothetical protein